MVVLNNNNNNNNNTIYNRIQSTQVDQRKRCVVSLTLTPIVQSPK